MRKGTYMSYRKSVYSKEQTDDWRGRIAIILAESQESLSIPEIQEKDIVLRGLSSQKMARMLGSLIEYNLVGKAKGKNGRMMYKSLAVMEKQGYDIEPYMKGVSG